ncbi:MAG: hypothetical protein JSS83_16320 [Cyanobacteria bacterium SZAS LIN-3]|nr:hypothetical protein [Cyanobacteria bacterium SZAS LIN-3]MBS2007751.1 hypothetical protein [Cyanobacteria bacterium SZAS TMP-1]
MGSTHHKVLVILLDTQIPSAEAALIKIKEDASQKCKRFFLGPIDVSGGRRCYCLAPTAAPASSSEAKALEKLRIKVLKTMKEDQGCIAAIQVGFGGEQGVAAVECAHYRTKDVFSMEQDPLPGALVPFDFQTLLYFVNDDPDDLEMVEKIKEAAPPTVRHLVSPLVSVQNGLAFGFVAPEGELQEDGLTDEANYLREILVENLLRVYEEASFLLLGFNPELGVEIILGTTDDQCQEGFHFTVDSLADDDAPIHDRQPFKHDADEPDDASEWTEYDFNARPVLDLKDAVECISMEPTRVLAAWQDRLDEFLDEYMKVPLAERGLQRVGFSFYKASGAVHQFIDIKSYKFVSEPHIQCTLRLRLVFDKLWELDKPRKKYSKTADYSNFDAALRDLELDVDTSWNLLPVLWTAGRDEFAAALARGIDAGLKAFEGVTSAETFLATPWARSNLNTACTMRLKYITGDLDGALDMLKAMHSIELRSKGLDYLLNQYKMPLLEALAEKPETSRLQEGKVQ